MRLTTLPASVLTVHSPSFRVPFRHLFVSTPSPLLYRVWRCLRYGTHVGSHGARTPILMPRVPTAAPSGKITRRPERRAAMSCDAGPSHYPLAAGHPVDFLSISGWQETRARGPRPSVAGGHRTATPPRPAARDTAPGRDTRQRAVSRALRGAKF